MVMKKDSLDSNEWWKEQQTINKNDFLNQHNPNFQKRFYKEFNEDEDSNNTWHVYRKIE